MKNMKDLPRDRTADAKYGKFPIDYPDTIKHVVASDVEPTLLITAEGRIYTIMSQSDYDIVFQRLTVRIAEQE